jgi:hypothetical protein
MSCKSVILPTSPRRWDQGVLRAGRFLGDLSTRSILACRQRQSVRSVQSCDRRAICYHTIEHDAGWMRLETC